MLKIKKYWDNGNTVFDSTHNEESEIIVEVKCEYGNFFIYINSYMYPINEEMISDKGEKKNVAGQIISKYWISYNDYEGTRYLINCMNQRLMFGAMVKNILLKDGKFDLKDNLEIGCRYAVEKLIGHEMDMAFGNEEPSEEEIEAMFDYFCHEYAV